MFKPLQFASCPRCFGSKLFKLAEGVYRCATVGCRFELPFAGVTYRGYLVGGEESDPCFFGVEVPRYA